ncbi:MAG: TlpA disulfide reductase family protein [Novosphingobium sp.]|nr:TlpA disulfide reductase family protein [Novosphingobium sp.]
MLLSRSLTLAVLGFALIAGGCDRQSGEDAQPRADAAGEADTPASKLDRSHAGKALPTMTLRDAQGNTLDLQALKGKPLLLNLWATWCAPCIAELPTLNELAQRHKGRLRVLTVSQDMANTDKVASFLKKRGLDQLEAWLDPESDLTFELGAQMLPTTIFFDSDGDEIWRYLGDKDWADEEAAVLLNIHESAEGLRE